MRFQVSFKAVRFSRQAGLHFAPKMLFWVALLLVFAQVAHAFDACTTHLEDACFNAMVVKVPCPVDQVCEDCSVVPVKDVCDSVSELAVAVAAGAQLNAPPIIFVDAPFIASPVPRLEARTVALFSRAPADVPPLRSQYLAPRLSGRAPPLSV